jgi:hypothetical protein
VRSELAALPRETDVYRIYPEPDVGVFSEDDFLSQKTRPGMVEIGDAHFVLRGSKETPEWARKFVASAIDPAEALYLLENRLTEIAGLAQRLERGESEGFHRYVHYVLLKSGLDAVTAVLIVLGLFHPSRNERMKRFRDVGARGDLQELLPRETVAYTERCYRSLGDLQETLEMDRGNLPGLRGDVESLLLGAWKRIAERLGSMKTGEWSDLLDWRCKAGQWPGNLRELSALAKRMSLPRIGVLRRSRRLGALSPVDALRLSGTVEILLRRTGEACVGAPLHPRVIEKRYVSFLDALTRSFGYTSGPVFERARRMFKETA